MSIAPTRSLVPPGGRDFVSIASNMTELPPGGRGWGVSAAALRLPAHGFFEEMFGTGAFHIIEKAVEPEWG